MQALETRLDECHARVGDLLAALDGDAPTESIELLASRQDAAFAQLADGLAAASKGQVQALRGRLEGLRRDTALAAEQSRARRQGIVVRLEDVAKARMALRELDPRSLGESCDIAG